MTKQNKKPAAKPNAGASAATKIESTTTADANLIGATADAAGTAGADATGADATGAADANLTDAVAAAGASNAGEPGADKSDTKKQKVKALQVVAKVESFRRGGRVFNRTEATVKLSELTDEQIKQIKEEPLLTVSEVEVDAE